MKDKLNIAVVGATGMVGEAMLEILAERKFPVGRLHALASERSLGKTVSFGNKEVQSNIPPCLSILSDTFVKQRLCQHISIPNIFESIG